MPFTIAFTEQLPTLALLALGASEAVIGLQSGLARALFVLQLPGLRLVSWISKRSLLFLGHGLSLVASAPLIAFAFLETLEPGTAIGLVFVSLFFIALGISLCELVWFPLLRGYVEPDRVALFRGDPHDLARDGDRVLPGRTLLARGAPGLMCGLAPLLAGIVLEALLARALEPLAVYRGFFLVAAALQAMSFLPLRAFR